MLSRPLRSPANLVRAGRAVESGPEPGGNPWKANRRSGRRPGSEDRITRARWKTGGLCAKAAKFRGFSAARTPVADRIPDPKSQFCRNPVLLRPQGVATVGADRETSPLFVRCRPTVALPLTTGGLSQESWGEIAARGRTGSVVLPPSDAPGKGSTPRPSHPLGARRRPASHPNLFPKPELFPQARTSSPRMTADLLPRFRAG